MINLESLEQAFAEVESIGKGEKTFDVGGTAVTLRVLYPQEETAVQEYAAQAIGDDEDAENETGTPAVMSYLDRFKQGTLAYAIIQVGDTDLRGVDYVPTGEKLPNGKEIKIPKHESLMSFVARWASPVRDGIFRKYGELLNEVGDAAEKAIRFEPSDFDAEIERVEERLAELKAQKQAAAEAGGMEFSDKVAAINDLAQGKETPEDKAPEPEPKVEQAAEPEPKVEQPVETKRRSAVPQQATPPTASKQTPTAAMPSPAVTPQPANPKPYVPSDESLVDSSNLEAAVEAENRRLLEQRMAGHQALPEDSGSVLDAVRNHVQKGGRVPPHFDAQQVADALPSEPVAQVGGADAFRLDEPQTLGTQPSQGSAKANINPQPQGKRNPRFRPPNT